ncbi:tRNA (adenosine(37)-N6)-threonylcarbamoyltransferase complex dimerization subunit type 1 TsaB [Kaarinaea lacus]
MNLLALETATEACSAALLVNDEVIERYQVSPRGHSQLILPMIDELLDEAGIAMAQIDGIAFGQGPGAFTGLRIAVGVTQGIAFAADIPVIPVSTLAALAQGCEQQDRVLAAIDARMDEVYWGVYRRRPDGLMAVEGEEQVVSPGEVPVPEADSWYGAGSGWDSYRQTLEIRCGDRLNIADGQLLPRAGAVARLGAADFQAGKMVSAEQAIPVYLRDQVAWKKSR